MSSDILLIYASPAAWISLNNFHPPSLIFQVFLVHSGLVRNIAQPGSASASGAEGREFESLYSDHSLNTCAPDGLIHLGRLLFGAFLSPEQRPTDAGIPREFEEDVISFTSIALALIGPSCHVSRRQARFSARRSAVMKPPMSSLPSATTPAATASRCVTRKDAPSLPKASSTEPPGLGRWQPRILSPPSGANASFRHRADRTRPRPLRTLPSPATK